MSLLPGSARSFHKGEFGEVPFVVASAPGCVNLFGDFTEDSEGFLLGFTLAQRVYVGLSPRGDNQVRFVSREFSEKKRCTTATLKFRKEDRWANYPKGAIAYLLPEDAVSGLSLSVISEVPPGIGLGSSQALTLAGILAASEFFGYGLDDQEAVVLAWKVENEFVQAPCTRSAQTFQTSTVAGSVYLLDCRYRRMVGYEIVDGPAFFLINSRVPLRVFESLFLHNRDTVAKALHQLNRGRPGKTLRDFSRADLRARMGDIPENLRRRALFVVDEIARAQEAADHLVERDWKSVGKLMSKAHEGLRDLFEVSCPEIDWLVKRALETEGVHGARMVSRGGGASVLIVAEAGTEAILRQQLEEYERIFGFHPEFVPTRPAGKAQVHTIDS